MSVSRVASELAPAATSSALVSRTPDPKTLRSGQSELKGALAACRGALIGIAILTVVINVLTLTGSLFMLEVYDRVLPSRSVPTLVGLAVLTVVLLAGLTVPPAIGRPAGPMLGAMVAVLVALLLVEGVTAVREHSREDER